MANVVLAVFVVILCITANVISERHGDEIDVYAEILNLKARLDQKNVVIEKLQQQLDMFTKRDRSKRLVMEMDFEQEITNMKTRLDQKDKEMEHLKQQLGSTYIRWGRTTCPTNGTDLVYSGFMAGTRPTTTQKGTGANYLCLSDQPTWDHYSETVNNDVVITGVEYDFYNHRPDAGHDLTDFFGSDIYNDDAPCSVCRSPRSTNVMIPGRMDCYPGWTKEYSGYLVGANPGFDDGSEYVCLDRRPEAVLNSGRDDDDNVLYFVETRCDSSLECPPYVNNRELACVVCSL